jgi:hypothetical protein
MTTELNVDQNDMAEALASFMLDDGDIAVERLVSPEQGSHNPFYVSDQPMETVASNWLSAVTFDVSADLDQKFDLIGHQADTLHFAVEDIHVSDVDLSSLQG